MSKIIARPARVRDNLNRTRMLVKIEPLVEKDDLLRAAAWDWLTVVTRTESIDGYDLPAPEDTPEQLWAALDAYLDLEVSVQTAWNEAVNAANAPAGAAAMQPGLDAAEKKDTATSDDADK